jgi:hypothetical protein
VKTLAIAPAFNTKAADATGAFIPEARSFVDMHQPSALLLFDNAATYGARMDECEKWLREWSGIEAVAIFSHGWRDGVQPGWRRGDIWRMAAALKACCVASPVVALYCCDTGRDADDDRADDTAAGPGGEGGFADMLRHELVRIGVRATIFAHTTEGHTTCNPYVRRFAPDEVAGGEWIVEPRSPMWRAWCRALACTDIRLRFPFMPQAEIEPELAAPRVS